MNFTLLYHRTLSQKERYALTPSLMRAHLEYLQKKYPVIFPRERKPFRFSVSLTFDDATFDFYHFIFPLLKELNLKAVLGVPCEPILEKTKLSPLERLDLMPTWKHPSAAFCTWEEIREMASSPLIEIASHSYSHANLKKKGSDLFLEVIRSKEILEKKTGQKITSFIYPYGKWNRSVQRFVSSHYERGIRIGSSINLFNQGLLFRIPCDDTVDPEKLFSPSSFFAYILKYPLNQIRSFP